MSMEPKGNDMAGDELVDAAAEAMWRAEVEGFAGVLRQRTHDAWLDQDDTYRAEWFKFAQAALAVFRLSRSTSTDAVVWDETDRVEAMVMSLVEDGRFPTMSFGLHGGIDYWRDIMRKLLRVAASHPSLQGGAEPASREQVIAAMSVELQHHPMFRGESVTALVWATRMYDAARPTHSIGETGGTDELVELRARCFDAENFANMTITDRERDWKSRAEAAESSLAAEKLKLFENAEWAASLNSRVMTLEAEQPTVHSRTSDGSPEVVEYFGKFFDRRETLDAQTSLLAAEKLMHEQTEQLRHKENRRACNEMDLRLAAEQRVAALVGALKAWRNWRLPANYRTITIADEEYALVKVIDAAHATET